MKRSLDLLQDSLSDLEPYRGKQIRLLKIKILCCLNVFSVKTGDEEFADDQLKRLLDFLADQRDQRMKVFELKIAIKLILDVDSIQGILKDMLDDSKSQEEEVQFIYQFP